MPVALSFFEMSETKLTEMFKTPINGVDGNKYWVPVDFSRKLERILRKSRRQVKDLTVRAQKAEAEARNYRRALTVVHDELLRGHDDITLLNMLEAGYRGTLFND
jgi:hypothetical protein